MATPDDTSPSSKKLPPPPPGRSTSRHSEGTFEGAQLSDDDILEIARIQKLMPNYYEINDEGKIVEVPETEAYREARKNAPPHIRAEVMANKARERDRLKKEAKRATPAERKKGGGLTTTKRESRVVAAKSIATDRRVEASQGRRRASNQQLLAAYQEHGAVSDEDIATARYNRSALAEWLGIPDFLQQAGGIEQGVEYNPKHPNADAAGYVTARDQKRPDVSHYIQAILHLGGIPGLDQTNEDLEPLTKMDQPRGDSTDSAGENEKVARVNPASATEGLSERTAPSEDVVSEAISSRRPGEVTSQRNRQIVDAAAIAEQGTDPSKRPSEGAESPVDEAMRMARLSHGQFAGAVDPTTREGRAAAREAAQAGLFLSAMGSKTRLRRMEKTGDADIDPELRRILGEEFISSTQNIRRQLGDLGPHYDRLDELTQNLKKLESSGASQEDTDKAKADIEDLRQHITTRESEIKDSNPRMFGSIDWSADTVQDMVKRLGLLKSAISTGTAELALNNQNKEMYVKHNVGSDRAAAITTLQEHLQETLERLMRPPRGTAYSRGKQEGSKMTLSEQMAGGNVALPLEVQAMVAGKMKVGRFITTEGDPTQSKEFATLPRAKQDEIRRKAQLSGMYAIRVPKRVPNPEFPEGLHPSAHHQLPSTTEPVLDKSGNPVLDESGKPVTREVPGAIISSTMEAPWVEVGVKQVPTGKFYKHGAKAGQPIVKGVYHEIGNPDKIIDYSQDTHQKKTVGGKTYLRDVVPTPGLEPGSVNRVGEHYVTDARSRAFSVPGIPNQITFTRDETGKVVGRTISPSREKTHFTGYEAVVAKGIQKAFETYGLTPQLREMFGLSESLRTKEAQQSQAADEDKQLLDYAAGVLNARKPHVSQALADLATMNRIGDAAAEAVEKEINEGGHPTINPLPDVSEFGSRSEWQKATQRSRTSITNAKNRARAKAIKEWIEGTVAPSAHMETDPRTGGIKFEEVEGPDGNIISTPVARTGTAEELSSEERSGNVRLELVKQLSGLYSGPKYRAIPNKVKRIKDTVTGQIFATGDPELHKGEYTNEVNNKKQRIKMLSSIDFSNRLKELRTDTGESRYEEVNVPDKGITKIKRQPSIAEDPEVAPEQRIHAALDTLTTPGTTTPMFPGVPLRGMFETQGEITGQSIHELLAKYNEGELSTSTSQQLARALRQRGFRQNVTGLEPPKEGELSRKAAAPAAPVSTEPAESADVDPYVSPATRRLREKEAWTASRTPGTPEYEEVKKAEQQRAVNRETVRSNIATRDAWLQQTGNKAVAVNTPQATGYVKVAIEGMAKRILSNKEADITSAAHPSSEYYQPLRTEINGKVIPYVPPAPEEVDITRAIYNDALMRSKDLGIENDFNKRRAPRGKFTSLGRPASLGPARPSLEFPIGRQYIEGDMIPTSRLATAGQYTRVAPSKTLGSQFYSDREKRLGLAAPAEAPKPKYTVSIEGPSSRLPQTAAPTHQENFNKLIGMIHESGSTPEGRQKAMDFAIESGLTVENTRELRSAARTAATSAALEEPKMPERFPLHLYPAEYTGSSETIETPGEGNLPIPLGQPERSESRQTFRGVPLSPEAPKAPQPSLSRAAMTDVAALEFMPATSNLSHKYVEPIPYSTYKAPEAPAEPTARRYEPPKRNMTVRPTGYGAVNTTPWYQDYASKQNMAPIEFMPKGTDMSFEPPQAPAKKRGRKQKLKPVSTVGSFTTSSQTYRSGGQYTLTPSSPAPAPSSPAPAEEAAPEYQGTPVRFSGSMPLSPTSQYKTGGQYTRLGRRTPAEHNTALTSVRSTQQFSEQPEENKQ